MNWSFWAIIIGGYLILKKVSAGAAPVTGKAPGWLAASAGPVPPVQPFAILPYGASVGSSSSQFSRFHGFGPGPGGRSGSAFNM